jgi:hypothetical protein
MMAVIAVSPIDQKEGRARLSQSDAKGNWADGIYWHPVVSRNANFCHHKSCRPTGISGYCCWCEGRNWRSFAMSELSGIVSLFLIAAAFLTSCDNQQSPPKAGVSLPALHLGEQASP